MDRNVYEPVTAHFVRGSLSARRAWIEIKNAMEINGSHGSLSARRAWIEIKNGTRKCGFGASLSARRAWIEIAHP